jgi:predicted amidophosphoribosyltransferase
LKDRIFRWPNHAKKLATLCVKTTEANTIFCPLKKKFFAGHQSRRTKSERKQIQSEIFLKKHQEVFLKNKDILIIDDLITTGHTAHTMGKLLKQAWARTVQGLFLSSKKV